MEQEAIAILENIYDADRLEEEINQLSLTAGEDLHPKRSVR